MGSGTDFTIPPRRLASLRSRFLSSVAMPNADILIELNFNAYDAFMLAGGYSTANVANGMGADAFDGMDWPEAIARPCMHDVVDGMRRGTFVPDGHLVAKFCDVLGISPERLVPADRPGPAPAGVVEAAVLMAGDNITAPSHERVRAFLAREVMKARALDSRTWGVDTMSNQTYLERVEKFWSVHGDTWVMDPTLSPVTQIRARWDDGMALYAAYLEDKTHSNPLYVVPKTIPGFDVHFARGVHYAEKVASDWIDYVGWTNDGQTEDYLQSKALERCILGRFTPGMLGIVTKPVREERPILRMPELRGYKP